ncbi:VWD domain-containing protein [Alkalinema pantanalense CENA528]|uniref:VWD domain-containing protein n=1 Tax=Alkalinema pantanalense TaxID=1620705 RepID=UPI003D6E8107
MQTLRRFRHTILAIVAALGAIGLESLLRRGMALILSAFMLGGPTLPGELVANAQDLSDELIPPTLQRIANCTLNASGDLNQGRSYGDPHIKTFDGKTYSFQTVGEFLLAKAQNNPFEIQARHTPVNPSLSLNSAVAMRICGDRLSFYTQNFPDGDSSHGVWVNGKPITVGETPITLPTGGAIALKDNLYVINSPTGEKVTLAKSTVQQQTFFNIAVFIPNSQRNQMIGLLGNFNGNPKDDMTIRGKGVLPEQSSYGNLSQALSFVGVSTGPVSLSAAEQLYFKQMYNEFGNSWRVSATESLFDYPQGMTTAKFTDLKFPNEYLTLNMLGRQRIEAAQQTCQKEGVTADMMEGCIFDVGFSGFSGFARTTAQVNSYLKTAQALFPGLGIPTVEQAVDRAVEKVRPKVCLPFVGCR